MVSPERVEAILDWELAHLGDPLEDLGWFCVAGVAVRRRRPTGRRVRLVEGHGPPTRRPAVPRSTFPDAARWWEVYGTLRWGVICIA